MRLKALCILALLTPALSASGISCNAGAASIPVLSLSDTSDAVGEYTLACTGGTQVPPGNPPPQINIDFTLNTAILTSAWNVTDGTNTTSGTRSGLNQITFTGVPFSPDGSGDVNFTIEDVLVNPSAQPSGFEYIGTSTIVSNFAIDVLSPNQEVAVNAVPEPSTLWLAGLAVSAMWLVRRCRRPVTSG